MTTIPLSRVLTMTTITFDTLKFSRTLTDSGIPESQADAFTRAIQEAQKESDLATKIDIRDVDTRFTGEVKLLRSDLMGKMDLLRADTASKISDIASEIKLIKWMLGATFGGIIFILLRLLLPGVH